MLTALTIDQTKGLLYAVFDRIIREKPYLTQLDSPIGDADHGIGMSRGVTAARKTLEEKGPYTNVNTLFTLTGRSMIATMGGSSGAVFGTMFYKAASKMEPMTSLTASTFTIMMRQGLDEVQKRGKAVVGQKTMVDALEPAVIAMEKLVNGSPEEKDLLVLFRAGADAAFEGAEKTKEMVAKHGHSKTLGERALGHPDPGAVSIALIFDAMAGEAERIAGE